MWLHSEEEKTWTRLKLIIVMVEICVFHRYFPRLFYKTIAISINIKFLRNDMSKPKTLAYEMHKDKTQAWTMNTYFNEIYDNMKSLLNNQYFIISIYGEQNNSIPFYRQYLSNCIIWNIHANMHFFMFINYRDKW